MIEEAVAAVRAGKVVGLPTDTVYGLGADPLNPDAVARLFDIKGRPLNRPVGVLVATLEQAEGIGELSEQARHLAAAHWPGALTLIIRPRVVLANWVGDSLADTVGVRIPDHPLAMRLLEKTGPLAVTSANRSGGPELMSDTQAMEEFGDEVEVCLPGTSPGGEASTVVDATSVELTVLRAGPVSV